jgi:hypothetical protein
MGTHQLKDTAKSLTAMQYGTFAVRGLFVARAMEALPAMRYETPAGCEHALQIFHRNAVWLLLAVLQLNDVLLPAG